MTAPKPLTTGGDPLIKTALSILADQYVGEYINPASYAKRSVEERRDKAEKDGGKITRPLNSYMLYRKAYQQIARRVLSNDQQQFASQIVGISWNEYESPAVKAEFKTLAKIDHQMHHKAFPDYKYTPTQGRNSRGSATESKKLSSSMERRLCRRTGGKAGAHVSSGKKVMRSGNTDALGQHSSGEGNVNFNWWHQEMPSFTAPLMHHSGPQERYEQCLMPDSTYFGAQYSDVLDDNTFNHLPRQAVQLAASPPEGLNLDSCIDPSLFTRFENINVSQSGTRYMEWQPQGALGAPMNHDFHSTTPDMGMRQQTDPAYEGQEEWSVQHSDDRRNTFGWHTIGENRNG
ncbi:high mobility group, HMG1/HMG2 [Pochonia chlamydosporia 170]|uniref:High mobility group, HMG1/HMG2 n=1 Tax=Pochonia chlamydosporia 170 TaxID=1380566 RepID=A0A179FEX8_METCM|nr:high mobility group, HMG1/HMG2 [Pochonia chlamydosporia 170]OAQ64155.1 high mobility group, HMG1/HMG2 [Pochonia chlamydosporia 170]